MRQFGYDHFHFDKEIFLREFRVKARPRVKTEILTFGHPG